MKARGAALVVLLMLLSACVDDKPQVVQPYDRAPVPAVPDRTAAIDPTWLAEDSFELGQAIANQINPDLIADGDYWAEAVAVGSGQPFILFVLSQAFFGRTCIERFGDDACTEDYGVLDEPKGTLHAMWDELQSVTVAATNRQNYAVPGAELASLIAGNAPMAGSPADYTYVSFPFLLTVRAGKVVDAHQIWVLGAPN